MSPFAEALRALRIRNGLRQEDLAELMACDRGRISALENDQREGVTQEFVDAVAVAVRASEQDHRHLLEAMRWSQRAYVVPSDAPVKAYELARELFDRIDRLSEAQIDVLRGVLRLGGRDGSDGEDRKPARQRLYRKDKIWRDETVP